MHTSQSFPWLHHASVDVEKVVLQLKSKSGQLVPVDLAYSAGKRIVEVAVIRIKHLEKDLYTSQRKVREFWKGN